MSSAEFNSPLLNSHADDEEIKRYARLLDSLAIGLVVYSPDAAQFLRNKMAALLLGDTTQTWMNESGHMIPRDEFPEVIVLRTKQAVYDCTMTLADAEINTSWLSINAIPVFDENGNVRRVLTTVNDITDLRALQHEIGLLTTHDSLTGAFNNPAIMHLLEKEIRRAQRYGTPFTIAQLDIDSFLPLCEKHGKENGDLVLSGIGKLLCESVREIDLVGRIGNDEFLLVLPNVRLNDAIIGMERLRLRVEAQPLTPDNLFVTISGGITEYAGENATVLVERSKSLLIHAREAGRNRFCLDMDIL